MPNLNLSAATVMAGVPTVTNAVQKDGYWYAYSTDGTNCRMFKSADLINWSVVGTAEAFSIDTGPDVLAVGGGYYAFGANGHYRYSTDATNWTLAFIPGGDGLRVRVKYLGGRFFVFSTAGLLSGATMATLSAASGVAGARAVEYDGKGTFVCIGADHKVYTSTDGSTWSANAFTGVVAGYGGDPYFTNLTYGEGVWIASGNSMNLFRSTDLVNWTIPDTGGEYGLAYGAGLWVALDGFGLKSSADGGVTWTAESVPLSDESGGGVSYANGLWVVSRRGSQLAFGHAKAQPFNRLFTGVVRDSSGNFAARRVSLLREDHTVINSTVSSIIDGSWTLKSPHAGETLLLITGEPAKNAIVYDRITPPAAT